MVRVIGIAAVAILMAGSASAADKLLETCLADAAATTRIAACQEKLSSGDLPPVQSEMVLFSLGEAQLETGQLEPAYAAFIEAEKLQPSRGDTKRMLGHVLLVARQYRDALIPLDRALQLNPNDAEAWNLWGAAHAAIGDPKKALSGFYKSLQIDPSSVVTLKNRAKLFMSQNNFRRAMGDLKRARRIAPDDASVTGLIAQIQQGS